jgi:hypothetical protein
VPSVGSIKITVISSWFVMAPLASGVVWMHWVTPRWLGVCLGPGGGQTPLGPLLLGVSR